MLQAVFFAQMAAEESKFSIEDSLDAIVEKLIRRHPHVFASGDAKTPDQVKERWDQIKREEKREQGQAEAGLLDGVPRVLPALMEAQQLTSRAASVGFDWEKPEQVLVKLEEELKELDEARKQGLKEEVEHEVGDVLFVLVNLARLLKVDAEQALRGTNAKFRGRFGYLERKLAEPGQVAGSGDAGGDGQPLGGGEEAPMSHPRGQELAAGGPSFLGLLRDNRNYRYTWMGQVVSEIGDHFNNVAVFSLALERTGSGMVVTGIMLARAIPAVMAGPLAGVLLDRMDRKRIMIVSDLVRAVVAALFILTVEPPRRLAAVRAQRPADVRLAVLHQRPLLGPAGHRQPRRAPHGQLAHPDHAVDYLDDRHASRGRRRWRSSAGSGRSCVNRSRSSSRPGRSRACAWPRAVSAPSELRSPRPKWCGRGTSTPRACATCGRRR